MKMAIQLYTLREECAKDFVATLEKVAALGFKGVEFAGYHGLEAAELRGHLRRLGLAAAGNHVSYDQVVNLTDDVIEYNKIIGNRNITVPGYPLKTEADVDALAQGLLSVVDKYKQNDMTVSYHNHDFEFEKADGKLLLDMLVEKTAGRIKLELDLFWVHVGGIDPSEYLRKNASVTQLIHLKDGNGRSPTAIGEGELNIAALVDTANELGIEWAVLENDIPTPDGISDVSRSCEYLKNNFSSQISFN